MTEVIIFGGTTEGRELAEFCVSMKICTGVCVVSEYGSGLLPRSEYLTIYTGRMDAGAMARLLDSQRPVLVFDATHPYAAAASDNIRQACRDTGLTVIRVLRSESRGERPGEVISAATIEEAVTYLEQDSRPVLVTTGSRELIKYQALENYQERIYARVLASHEGIAACEALGLPGSHIIAMQGPFSRRMNEALLEQIGAGWLVTKESGIQGGFAEKLAAAEARLATVIVIGRPRREAGISLDEARRRAAALRDKDKRPEASFQVNGQQDGLCYDGGSREAVLVGIGMGSPGLLTAEAVAAIKSSDALLGAPRMLAAVAGINDQALTGGVYLPDDVCMWLREHPRVKVAAVLFSGDTGFYSGAGAVRAALEAERPKRWRVRTLPGISTVAYLCARLQTGWADVHLCSLHGRDCDVAGRIRSCPRVFCLLGGSQPVRDLCVRLGEMSDVAVRITVGEWLSYPRERIVSGSWQELITMEFSGFCAVLIERITTDAG